MSAATGLGLALLSAFALNWGWVAQHGAASELPPLSLRAPIRSLRALYGDLSWLTGFLVGIAGWALYVAALAFAPLALVQAVSAGGVGLLALFAARRGERVSRAHWLAVGIAIGGLALLGVSLAGGAATGSHPRPGALAGWLLVSAVVAALAASRGRAAALGVAAGVLYAGGDVATKAATPGGAWLALVPVVLVMHGSAFAALQLGFQRGGALVSAGPATLLTNAIPILAGAVLFAEQLPGGAFGALRVVAFACVVAGAALIAVLDPDARLAVDAAAGGESHRNERAGNDLVAVR